MVTFFLQDFQYTGENDGGGDDSKKTPVFPRDMEVIPAFTIVDIVIAPTHSQASQGFGMKLASIAPHASSTLYSYMSPNNNGTGLLDLLPHSEAEAKQYYETREASCERIQSLIERTRECFYVRLPKGSFLVEYAEYPEYLRAVCSDVCTMPLSFRFHLNQ